VAHISETHHDEPFIRKYIFSIDHNMISLLNMEITDG